MKILCLLLTCLALASCARCSAPAGPIDAGQHRRAVGDVRTALLFAFPEYRGVFVEHADARLTRRYSALPPDFAQQGLQRLGWALLPDGGWHVSAYVIEHPAPDTLTLHFTLDDERVHRLFEAPIGASTMELGLYLPREAIVTETFSLQVDYVTAPARAGFLVKQVASLLTASQQWTATFPPGWETQAPDGGPAAPDPLDLTVTGRQDGATVRLVRAGGRVSARYELVTDELMR